MDWGFDNTYARELPWLGASLAPVPVRAPEGVFVNHLLAMELGLDPRWLAGPEGTAVVSGSAVPDGAEPIAQAYAGHQFGFFSPRLGDGRAHLLGEVVDVNGVRRDIALKGSGRTPFSRGGDGRAAIGPVLREVLVSEAMSALGVPTTRALAAAETGEQVWRDGRPERGAVLTRVAASHLRVGTLELVRTQGSLEQLGALVDFVRRRHYPQVQPGDVWGLFDEIASRQADLVARWVSLGFIHGVMNTDNMALSGETIDYGPCAFLDRYDPETVYSSIDTAGRYRYSAQPSIAGWNLARLAESLLPLAEGEPDAAVETATERVNAFAERYAVAERVRMAAKVGLGPLHGDTVTEVAELDRLVGTLLGAMHRASLDFTGTFRALARSLRDGGVPEGLEDWVDAWRPHVPDPAATARAMDAVNPAYIPRNHLVEEALDAARDGDRQPFERLLDVLREPFVERPGLERYAEAAPERFTAGYVTFCGT
jgi:serine/tyrosine/threonine adenylyltransferase